MRILGKLGLGSWALPRLPPPRDRTCRGGRGRAGSRRPFDLGRQRAALYRPRQGLLRRGRRRVRGHQYRRPQAPLRRRRGRRDRHHPHHHRRHGALPQERRRIRPPHRRRHLRRRRRHRRDQGHRRRSKDLKGKKVAFNEGSTSQFLLDVLLAENGMSEADVVPVNMDPGDAGAALIAGQVDAAVDLGAVADQGQEQRERPHPVRHHQPPGLHHRLRDGAEGVPRRAPRGRRRLRQGLVQGGRLLPRQPEGSGRHHGAGQRRLAPTPPSSPRPWPA